MAVARSGTGTVQSSTDATFNTAGDAVTFSFDAGTDSNRLLVINVVFNGSAAHTIGDSAVTYNSVAATALGATTSQSNARQRTYVLVAPATGSNTVSVDPSAGAGDVAAIIEVYCFSGVDQTTATDGYTTANGADTSAPYESVVTVSSATDDMILFLHSVNASGVTGASATNYTERLDNVNGTGSGTMGAESGEAAGTTSVTGTATWAGVFAINWIAHGFNMNAAAGGDTPVSASDTGAWADTPAETATYTATDTGGFADTEESGRPASDTGAWDDAHDATAAYTETETGGWADLDDLLVALGVSDPGSWGEDAALTLDNTASDTGGASDSAVPAADYGETETGSLGETTGETATASATDTGGFSETATVTQTDLYNGVVSGTATLGARLAGTATQAARLAGTTTLTPRVGGTTDTSP